MKSNPNPHQAHAHITDRVLDLRFKDQYYSIPLANIRKMHIRKRRATYFPTFMGLMVYVEDRTYKLRIKLQDGQRICLKLRPQDCWHFTGAVREVRQYLSSVAQAS